MFCVILLNKDFSKLLTDQMRRLVELLTGVGGNLVTVRMLCKPSLVIIRIHSNTTGVGATDPAILTALTNISEIGNRVLSST